MIRTPLNALYFHAVVSSDTDEVIEFFGAREDALRFIARVHADEPEHARLLRVARFEVAYSRN